MNENKGDKTYPTYPIQTWIKCFENNFKYKVNKIRWLLLKPDNNTKCFQNST